MADYENIKSSVTYDKWDSGSLLEYLSKHTKPLGQNYWLLIYSHSKIILETLDSIRMKQIDFKQQELKEVRAFSSSGELKIWKYQGSFKSRLRIDGHGEVTEVLNDKHLLWGLSIEGNALIEKNKGVKIEFPIDISKHQVPFGVVVKNYLDYDEYGLVTVVDARLVKFTDIYNNEVQNV